MGSVVPWAVRLARMTPGQLEARRAAGRAASARQVARKRAERAARGNGGLDPHGDRPEGYPTDLQAVIEALDACALPCGSLALLATSRELLRGLLRRWPRPIDIEFLARSTARNSSRAWSSAQFPCN